MTTEELEEEKIPICKHCWVEVTVIPEAKTLVGKGEVAVWKHRYLKDPDGNPACDRRLFDTDLEYVERPL
jgi:hypothetical protein